jgi:hypothetical protein
VHTAQVRQGWDSMALVQVGSPRKFHVFRSDRFDFLLSSRSPVQGECCCQVFQFLTERAVGGSEAPQALSRIEGRRLAEDPCRYPLLWLVLPRSGDHLGTTRHARDQTTRMWLNAVPDS